MAPILRPVRLIYRQGALTASQLFLIGAQNGVHLICAQSRQFTARGLPQPHWRHLTRAKNGAHLALHLTNSLPGGAQELAGVIQLVPQMFSCQSSGGV